MSSIAISHQGDFLELEEFLCGKRQSACLSGTSSNSCPRGTKGHPAVRSAGTAAFLLCPCSTCGSFPKESSTAATLPCLSLLTTLWACCRRSHWRCGSHRTAGTWWRGHRGPWAPGNQEHKSKRHNLIQEIREKQEKRSALLIHKLQNARVVSVIIRPLNPVCQV